MRKIKNIVWLLVLIIFNTTYSQEETVGSEVVNIVKPYTPTISDAFKVKETPVMEDEDNTQKEKIEYNIFSFPVASTFTPAKGKAAAVDKTKREKIFRNYATLGVGNYATINAELFVTENFSRTAYGGAMLRHLSSQGGIKDAVLDDKYYDTSLDLTYGTRERDMSWNVDLGLKNQIFNWYGLPIKNIFFDEETIKKIDAKQSYNTILLGGQLNLEKSFFNQATLIFKRFSDATGSGENRFNITPHFDFDVLEQKIKTNFTLDYVGGNFERGYSNDQEIKYSNVVFGASPSVLYQQDDLSVELGAGIFYTTGKINGESDSKLFVYPDVKASYRLVGDLLIGYAGAEGTLKQNSYADFVAENPFISPTQMVVPSDNKYEIYVGMKGKISNTVSFNVKGAFDNAANKPLYVSNDFILNNTNDKGYAHANSFQVVYDKVKTTSIFGEVKADFSEQVTFNIQGTYFNYSTDQQAEAWNLPQLKIATGLDFEINKKWFAGANIFFVGERKDWISVQNDLSVNPGTFTQKEVVLDSYFDLNANIGYRYNERLTAFLRGNNLANQQYFRWNSYPVQGIQILLGAHYKFDF